MLLLELFKGTGSVGDRFKHAGYDILSVDIEEKFKPDICINILELDYKKLPIPNVIWASVPCTTYSCISYRWHHRNSKTMKPISLQATIDDKVLIRTIDIIEYFLEIDPGIKYIIENPHGTMWKSPYLQRLNYNIALTYYILYDDDRWKPTDFINNFHLKLKTHSNPRSLKPKRKIACMSLLDKYRIPSMLVDHIITQLKDKM